MYLEDIPLGSAVLMGEHTFTEDEIIAFARKFDPLPMHIDPIAAKDGPFGGVVASCWHVLSVWMGMMVRHREKRVAEEGGDMANRYAISPGFRQLRVLEPVRPGTTIQCFMKPSVKRDWPARPNMGILESYNEIRGGETLYMSFIGRSLLQKRPQNNGAS